MCLFNIQPTAKVIWGQGHGLKSHLTDKTDWGSTEMNLQPLVYEASGLSITWWLLVEN